MNWHYIDGDKIVGPLTREAMIQLRTCDMLSDDSKIARDGADVWSRYGDVFTENSSLPPVPVKASNPTRSGAWSKVVDGVSSAAGLGKLESAGAKNLFSELFRKRTIEEIEETFAIGTGVSTPMLNTIPSGWPAPWVFFRLIGFSVLMTLVFLWAIGRFNATILYPGFLFMGAFAVPFSLMVFFMETNVLRNVSCYRVLKLTLLGGLISLISTLALSEMVHSVYEWAGPMAAGPIEELAKVLAVVFVMKSWPRCHWTLNGILAGAAVGAGFAAFETAGYIMQYAENMQDGGIATMIQRALSAPFTHIIWTAATAGALWRFKGKNPFSFGMLTEWPVLRIILLSMALHALWNSPLTVPFVGDGMSDVVKLLAIGLVGWILVLLLIQDGLNQVEKAK